MGCSVRGFRIEDFFRDVADMTAFLVGVIVVGIVAFITAIFYSAFLENGREGALTKADLEPLKKEIEELRQAVRDLK